MAKKKKDELVEPKTDQGQLAVQELEIEQPPIKQVVRYISLDGSGQEGSWPNIWIEDYLAQYLRNGYRLLSANPFDKNPFGIGMIYVLILE